MIYVLYLVMSIVVFLYLYILFHGIRDSFEYSKFDVAYEELKEEIQSIENNTLDYSIFDKLIELGDLASNHSELDEAIELREILKKHLNIKD